MSEYRVSNAQCNNLFKTVFQSFFGQVTASIAFLMHVAFLFIRKETTCYLLNGVQRTYKPCAIAKLRHKQTKRVMLDKQLR